MLINRSTNEQEIEFEIIRGFSRVIDSHKQAGVTNDVAERPKTLYKVT
jgi:hypothetical protein